jgi:glycosyltransferase involved in cell wall biosynthesis
MSTESSMERTISKSHPRNIVTVHSGARDAYQVARALEEAGRLEALVTDLFWPAEASLASFAGALLPASLQQQLLARSAPSLPGSRVKSANMAGLLTLMLEKWKSAPFAWRRATTRWTDDRLGKAAGRMAARKGAALLSYSYYGYSAFSHFHSDAPALLFQLHPHPASMRRILTGELEKHPDCATSLKQECELSLPESDYQRLVTETTMPRAWLAASSFTKSTLVEHGIPADRVHVVPYGVDLERFHPASQPIPVNRPLRLLFVGRINQRKGVKYLLQALRQFPKERVELTVCGRVVDDLRLFEPYRSQVNIRPSVNHAELVEAYQSADLFAFPSVAEGFGHVLLESMACGLPVLSTTATAAPDLVTNGEDGFVVDPGSAAQLAERIDWALSNRRQLRGMKAAARGRAEQFTWQRFRRGVRDFVSRYCDEQDTNELNYSSESVLEAEVV